MELLFLWISDYRNIKRQSYNFSNEYIIRLHEKAQYFFELEIKRNPDYIPDFFENIAIRNITGIIGQNGSGKTSVLYFIKENFNGQAKSVDQESILFIKKDVTDELDSYDDLYRFYAPHHYKIVFAENTDPDLKKLFVGHIYNLESREDIPLFPVYDAFLNTSVIFYSNIYDGREEIELTGMHNISTNHLVNKARTVDYGNDETTKQIGTYSYSELLRNIDFVAGNIPLSHLPFNLPDRIEFDFINYDRRIVSSTLEKDYPIIELIEDYLDGKHQGENNFFINSFYCYCYLNVIRSLVEFNNPEKDKNSFNKDRLQDPLDSGSLASIIYESLRTFALYPNTFLAERAKDAMSLLNYFLQILEKGIIRIATDGQSASIGIKTNLDETKEFLNRYIISKAYTNFLYFRWNSLSSGQQSVLTMLSRFFSISESKVRNEDDRIKENLIILIDEGDVYFHPEWQRQFIHMIQSFLPEVYKGKKMQIILTSNSPFIASDLPKDNLIFIDRKGNVLPMLNNRENTFAANIHSLLADGFFMEKGVIGEFAQRKLTQLIKRIEGGEDPNPDLVRKEIKIIGEPLLVDRLESMFNDKYGYNEENFDQYVKNLEEQLLAAQELQRKRNERNK